MAVITIDADSDSNGVRSDAGFGAWNDARIDDPAAGVTSFITQANTSFQCGRYFAFFPMTSIPSGSTITAAKLVHPVVGNKTDLNSGSIHIVEHIATDPIGVDDFKNYKSLDSDTSFGIKDVTDLSTSATTDITINATGITYLESVIQGTAKIGLRSSEDFDNASPSNNSQYTTSVTDFDLQITYTPIAGGGMPIMSY